MRSFKSLSTSLLLVSLLTWSVFSAEFGYTDVYTSLSPTTNRRAQQVTMPADGQITAVAVYHNAQATGELQIGVYANNGSNQPSTKLGGSNKTNITNATGWQTINLTAPTSTITTGTKIWLAFMYKTNSGIQRFGTGITGATYIASQTTTWNTSGDNMTNPFGAVGSPVSNTAYSIKAIYTPAGSSYTLTVTASNGTVTKNPDQPSYPSGQTVTLTATPASCYLFSSWSGDASGSTNPLTITMNANKNITANFVSNPQCAGTDYWPSAVDRTGQNMKLQGNFNMVGDLNMLNQNKIYIYENMGQGGRATTIDRCAIDVMESSGSWGYGRVNISARNGIIASGKVTCSEVVVTATPVFPDYVFNKKYDLKSLYEVEKHIKENGRLPGMPSAEQVKKEGLSVGEMQTKLLEKIEEMTLHMIQMQKRIDELEAGKK